MTFKFSLQQVLWALGAGATAFGVAVGVAAHPISLAGWGAIIGATLVGIAGGLNHDTTPSPNIVSFKNPFTS